MVVPVSEDQDDMAFTVTVDDRSGCDLATHLERTELIESWLRDPDDYLFSVVTVGLA